MLRDELSKIRDQYQGMLDKRKDALTRIHARLVELKEEIEAEFPSFKVDIIGSALEINGRWRVFVLWKGKYIYLVRGQTVIDPYHELARELLIEAAYQEVRSAGINIDFTGSSG